ncbi:MAG: radical SAM protein [Proteobacteria bacterium]|nr:MAG: radical SAM protein [Pseudomonadota bacterium]PIE65328.1 MAG: radical SAM protein [Desulfobacterales bacterium]
MIFDIKRYSINDGPGIRTTVFFKGCPLRCAWCHNPESISAKPQKMYYESKCIGCRECVTACPENACQLTEKGIVTDLQRCTSCGICAEVCPTLATEMSGRIATVAEILEQVEKDRPFFEESHGGVTFSGGEPTRQAPFLHALLDECGRHGIHRAVDTCGLTTAQTLIDLVEKTDLFLYDLKLMDSAKHKEWTGRSNVQILENLRILARREVPIRIRIPLTAGVNDDDANINASVRFLADLGPAIDQVDILPYHNIAENKYKRLGRVYKRGKMAEPDKERVAQIEQQFMDYGLKTSIGG